MEAVQHARALLASGKVPSSNWTSPLKGVVRRRNHVSLRLVIRGVADIDNLCTCRPSREDGIPAPIPWPSDFIISGVMRKKPAPQTQRRPRYPPPVRGTPQHVRIPSPQSRPQWDAPSRFTSCFPRILPTPSPEERRCSFWRGRIPTEGAAEPWVRSGRYHRRRGRRCSGRGGGTRWRDTPESCRSRPGFQVPASTPAGHPRLTGEERLR